MNDSREQRQGPADIGTLLSRVIRERKWQRRLRQHRVFAFWDEAVGKDISSRAWPAFIRGNVLWVEVSDSVWMQHLHLQKLLLLDLINARLQEAAIADIRFQLAPSRMERKGVEEFRQSTSGPAVDAAKLAEFKGQLATVKNEEVRSSLLTLWLKAHAAG